jgi:hypothetical protein
MIAKIFKSYLRLWKLAEALTLGSLKYALIYVLICTIRDARRFFSTSGFSTFEFWAPIQTIWHYWRLKFYSDEENTYYVRTKRLMDEDDRVTADELDKVVSGEKETNEFGITGTVADFGPVQKGRFIKQVVAACKMKFGVPKRCEANRMAVRDYAVRIMKEVKHRPSHIVRDVPLVVRLVFQPTSEELLQARLESHPLAELEREQYAYAMGSQQI